MLNHLCNEYNCLRDVEECYCDKHIEQIRKEAFDEGFEEGKQFVRE